MIKHEDLGKEETRQLVAACFHELVEEVEAGHGFTPLTSEPDLEHAEQREMTKERITELSSQIIRCDFEGSIKNRAEAALAAHGKNASLLPHGRRVDLFEGVTRAMIEQQRLFLLRLDDRLKEFEPADPLFSKRLLAPFTPAQGVPVVATPQVQGPTVGHALQAYLDRHEKLWVRKTHAARVWQLRYLGEFLGADRALSTVTSHDVRAYRDAILCLRKNHGRSPSQSFLQKQTTNSTSRIADKTASLIFEPCKAFFRWAKSSEGMISMNPAEDVKITAQLKPKGQKTRRSFEAEELKQLFTAPIFTGCKSLHRRYEPGPKVIPDAKYWIPILGYYTGCRMGELAQLHFADVRLEGPIPHLSINEDNQGVSGSAPKKHVKSSAGIRLVPLHPDVMELGFASFVARRRKAKKMTDRLFPEFPYGSDGQASTVMSKWFARFMDTVGLTDPALVFHSFRHSAEDAFRDALQPQYVIDTIIGHSDGATSAGYGDGISLETAYGAVAAMKLKARLPKLWSP
ncbi:MAG: site-specific integrase [Sphingosinicella sp.]|nr:site-specific integrase [Sphingosinicella sp.]